MLVEKDDKKKIFLQIEFLYIINKDGKSYVIEFKFQWQLVLLDFDSYVVLGFFLFRWQRYILENLCVFFKILQIIMNVLGLE